MAQTSSAATAPTIKVPLLPNVTPSAWAAVMRAKPKGMSQSDWQEFATVAAEIGAGRTVASKRIKNAITIGKSVKGDGPVENVKRLEQAYESALLAEATPSGSKALAEQKPVAFGKARPTATAPAVAVKVAQPSKPGVAPSKTTIAQPSKPVVAQPSKPGIAKPSKPTVAATGEDAAYAKIADAVKAGKGKTFTYGKLNFAYEIARKKNDPVANSIVRDMREMRPLAPGPGRYGVSDKEYTNYAMVVAAITGGKDAPAAAMKTAAETARKFGHTEVALSITDKLPSAPAKAKAPTPVVAAKASAKAPAKTVAKVAVPAAAAATVTLHKQGQAVTGPEFYRGVPKSVWAKLPPPPNGVSADDWRTYAMVHYFLGTKNQMPAIDEIRTAAAVAAKVGKPQRSKIYTALTTGQTIPTMIAGRTAALATKPPSKYAAEIIGNGIIAEAAHSQDPKVLKMAADIAKQQGHAKTYTALLARIPKDAPAAGATAVAAKKDLPKGKIVAGKTSKPAGVTDVEWSLFTRTIQAVNAKMPVALSDLDRSKEIADRINYKQTSIQLARAAADLRHKEAVAAKTPAAKTPGPTPSHAMAPAPAPAKGGGPSAATVAKVAVPVAAAVAATGVIAAKVASKPAPEPAPSPSPAMVPADTVAEVPFVPSKKVVDTAAKATGVSSSAVAEKLQEARNDTGNARAEVAQGADLNRRLSSKDEQTVSVAREELRGIQTQKEAGDPAAAAQLAALGAAAASATAVAAATKSSEPPKPAVAAKDSPVEAPQASIAGKPESSGIAATVVAALGLAGMGVIALSRKKKRG